MSTSAVVGSLLTAWQNDDVDEAAVVEHTLQSATSWPLLLLLLLGLGCLTLDLTGTCERSVNLTYKREGIKATGHRDGHATNETRRFERWKCSGVLIGVEEQDRAAASPLHLAAAGWWEVEQETA